METADFTLFWKVGKIIFLIKTKMEKKLYRFYHLIIKLSWVLLIPTFQCRRHKRVRFKLWVGKIPWRRAWQHTSVFSPGELPWTEEPGELQSMLNHFSRVQLFATPWTAVLQAPLSMGLSRQKYWSELPFPSPGLQSIWAQRVRHD